LQYYAYTNFCGGSKPLYRELKFDFDKNIVATRNIHLDFNLMAIINENLINRFIKFTCVERSYVLKLRIKYFPTVTIVDIMNMPYLNLCWINVTWFEFIVAEIIYRNGSLNYAVTIL
jgi:hypothetical protein